MHIALLGLVLCQCVATCHFLHCTLIYGAECNTCNVLCPLQTLTVNILGIDKLTHARNAVWATAMAVLQ